MSMRKSKILIRERLRKEDLDIKFISKTVSHRNVTNVFDLLLKKMMESLFTQFQGYSNHFLMQR